MRRQRYFSSISVLATLLVVMQPWLAATAGEETVTLISLPTATPNPATVGVPITFTAGAVSAGGAAVLVDWNFGDGTTASGSNISHVYKSAGTYTVYVQAGSAQNSLTVRVDPLPQISSIQTIQNLAEEQVLLPGIAPRARLASRSTQSLAIAPFHILGADVTALDLTQETFVKFTKGSFSVTVPVMYLGATSNSATTHIQAVVPPVIVKGKPSSGAVNFSIIQGTGSTATSTAKPATLNVLALPAANATAPGSVMLSYLQAQQNALLKSQASANTSGYLNSSTSSAISTQAATLGAVITQLTTVVNNPSSPFPFSANGKSNPKALQFLDNLALGLMQGFTDSFASITPAVARADTQTIADQFNGLVSGIFGAGAGWWGPFGAFATAAGGTLLLLAATGIAPALAGVGLFIGIAGLGILCGGLIYDALQYAVKGSSLSAVVEESISNFTNSVQQQASTLLGQISDAASKVIPTTPVNVTQAVTQSTQTFTAQVPPPPPQSTFPTNIPKGLYSISVSTSNGTFDAGLLPNDGTAAFKNALLQVGAQFASQSGGGVSNTVSYTAFNGTSFSITYTSTATDPNGGTVSSSATITVTKVA